LAVRNSNPSLPLDTASDGYGRQLIDAEIWMTAEGDNQEAQDP
jgi:hypothetical protein